MHHDTCHVCVAAAIWCHTEAEEIAVDLPKLGAEVAAVIEKQQQENADAAARLAAEQAAVTIAAAVAVQVQKPPPVAEGAAAVPEAEAVAAAVTEKPAYVWSPQTQFSAKAMVDTVLWREKYSDVSDDECLKVST
jgi:ribosomal protein S12 methylthiotransferase accessory factor YcaO